MYQCSSEFDVTKLGVCLWEWSMFQDTELWLSGLYHFSRVDSPEAFHLLRQHFGLMLGISFFILHLLKLAGIFLSHMQSVFAQLPPYWMMTALSLTMVLKNWHPAQMSALGNVFIMLPFFISCFRTAQVFLFAYILVVMSPRELTVAFLYLSILVDSISSVTTHDLLLRLHWVLQLWTIRPNWN